MSDLPFHRKSLLKFLWHPTERNKADGVLLEQSIDPASRQGRAGQGRARGGAGRGSSLQVVVHSLSGHLQSDGSRPLARTTP